MTNIIFIECAAGHGKAITIGLTNTLFTCRLNQNGLCQVKAIQTLDGLDGFFDRANNKISFCSSAQCVLK
jgi:hypothetical protein